MQVVTNKMDQAPKKKQRKHLPLWKISAKLKTKTSLHIGSGELENIIIEKEQFVVSVLRDYQSKPYISASSLKGVLKSLAKKTNISPQSINVLFGGEHGESILPGAIEFRNSYLDKNNLVKESHLPNWEIHGHPHTANIPHNVINRDLRTSEEHKLFLEQVVPEGSLFDFECILQAVSEEDVEKLLGLLNFAGEENSTLRLGGNAASGNGRIEFSNINIRRIENIKTIWDAICKNNHICPNGIWEDPYSKDISKTLYPAELSFKEKHFLKLKNLKLDFCSPFLSYKRVQDKNKNYDAEPQRNHDGKVILPGSSFHGALRAQAEKILRTMGIETPAGYAVPSFNWKGKKLDLASVLFGAPGWKSLLEIPDFVCNNHENLINHQMVAINRVTGAGKEKALFSVKVADNPTLSGNITINRNRLELFSKKTNEKDIILQAIGLLAHVFRDLDQGDIYLGHGAAKGYGKCTSEFVDALEKQLEAENISKDFTLNNGLEVFSNQYKNESKIIKLTHHKSIKNKKDAENKYAINNQSNLFHNPYVFIPFGKNKDNWVERKVLEQIEDSYEVKEYSHASYIAGKNHGRLRCKICTKTPMFIGASSEKRKNNEVKKLANFKLSNQEIAIPSTSLRGMISSLHEALTASRPRVLDENRKYSSRKQAREALRDIGRVIEIKGKFYLQRLEVANKIINNKLQTMEKGSLKTYKIGDNKGVVRIMAAHNRSLPKNRKHELFLTFSAEQNNIVNTVLKDYKKQSNEVDIHEWIETQKYSLLPIPDKTIEKLNQLADERTVSQNNDEELELYKILPYHPIGTERNEKNKDYDSSFNIEDKKRLLRIKHNDLVFFKPSQNGKLIDEIGFSSIWRYGMPKTEPEYVEDTMGLDDDNKKKLSPSELLFGAVDIEKFKQIQESNGKAMQFSYASRIHFGFGKSDKCIELKKDVSLKILTSPKPPSPAMYFTKNDKDRYVSKLDLKTTNDNVLKGLWKYYLHARREDRQDGQPIKINKYGKFLQDNKDNKGDKYKMPWETFLDENDEEKNKRKTQRVKVDLIDKGNDFYFNIDFSNLNDYELQSLCAALKPFESFEHKLGMGKPIGLGSVKIEPIELGLIDRQERYSEKSFNEGQRYKSIWKFNDKNTDLDDQKNISPMELRDTFMASLKESQPDVYKALELIGNPSNTKHPVHYPQNANNDVEKENFKWFVENDAKHKQFISCLSNISNELPTLIRKEIFIKKKA